MANYHSTVERTFRALADPTRRRVVEALANGDASISELAEPFDMALPSFLKHVRVLEAAGLVTSRKRGRVKYCSLRADELDASLEWLEQRRTAWQTRLRSLDVVLEEGF